MKKLLFLLVTSSTLLLTSCDNDYNPSNNDLYQEIDLGLTVNWANKNVAATEPELYGEYYAFGEIITDNVYDWSTYKWAYVEFNVFFKKYTTDSVYNPTPDNKTQLEMSDDAARVYCKNKWRIPTKDEFQELSDSCQFVDTIVNKIRVCKIIGPNGNSILLPYAGICHDKIRGTGRDMQIGHYATRNLCEEDNKQFFIFTIDNTDKNIHNIDSYNINHKFNTAERCCGVSIRPVKNK